MQETKNNCFKVDSLTLKIIFPLYMTVTGRLFSATIKGKGVFNVLCTPEEIYADPIGQRRFCSLVYPYFNKSDTIKYLE